MQSKQLVTHHLNAFSKLSYAERLSWSFAQTRFFAQFMDAKTKKANKLIRKNGKKYFSKPDLADVAYIKKIKKLKKSGK